MLELAKQAGLKKDHGSDREYIGDFDWRLFGDLIVRECIQQCNQEWYDLNNKSTEGLDDRSIAIHVGQKNGVLKVQHRMKQHFGVEW